MKIRYGLIRDKVTDEDGELRTVYGIEVKKEGRVLRTVSDVFTEKETAEYYIGLFNTLGLSPIHLDDVLEDIL
jgi:hypothetical protein